MEPQLSYYYEAVASGSVYEVYDLKKLPAILNVQDAVEEINMSALNDYVLGNSLDNNIDKIRQEDAILHTLSLAYENLHTIPKIIVDELSNNIHILDISHNKIDDLSFLQEMKNLSSLICDHNEISSRTEIPYSPNLELLWLNHCKITELYPWCRKLRISCPNLRFLSLMGNPAIPSYIRGTEFDDYMQYRLFMISSFPHLIHLDEKRVTSNERIEAERLYQRPLYEKLIPVANSYLRKTTEKIGEILSSTPTEFNIIPKSNRII
ncbi:hypothetical protein HHI36_012650 [Cryptolaemus montrouzieri]|uniref:Leucine-rich repeat-containing protein n=1 Tax=Cryptolaemus montrouzieri TaxID=559131 RepID=A0ABD2NFI2_9CUCU